MALHPCPSCSRHVRPTEAACPFCASAFPDGFGAARRPEIANANRGLTRAALLFASATAIAGCGETTGVDNTSSSGKTSSSGGSSGTASGSSSGSVSSSSGSTSSSSGDVPVPMYGPAPIDDGGLEKDSGIGPKKDGGAVALYGPAPIDSGV